MKSNTNFRFSLGRRVGICPQCGHRTLKLYEDRATGWALDAAVGRCNREVKCKYHVTPAQYFAAGGHAPAVPAGWVAPPLPPPDEFVTIGQRRSPLDTLRRNALFRYMASMFGEDLVKRVWDEYQVMNSGWRGGAVGFSYVDHLGRCRSIKLMRYLPDGHRCKLGGMGFNVTWAHSLALPGRANFRFRACLFGAHLLLGGHHGATVYIVESEKSALMLACYLSKQFFEGAVVCLASGGASGIATASEPISDRFSRCFPLAGRRVVLLPDADMVERWTAYAGALTDHVRSIAVADVRRAPFFLTGSDDIADFIEAEYRRSGPGSFHVYDLLNLKES